jgi:hypothetical protein
MEKTSTYWCHQNAVKILYNLKRDEIIGGRKNCIVRSFIELRLAFRNATTGNILVLFRRTASNPLGICGEVVATCIGNALKKTNTESMPSCCNCTLVDGEKPHPASYRGCSHAKGEEHNRLKGYTGRTLFSKFTSSQQSYAAALGQDTQEQQPQAPQTDGKSLQYPVQQHLRQQECQKTGLSVQAVWLWQVKSSHCSAMDNERAQWSCIRGGHGTWLNATKWLLEFIYHSKPQHLMQMAWWAQKTTARLTYGCDSVFRDSSQTTWEVVCSCL